MSLAAGTWRMVVEVEDEGAGRIRGQSAYMADQIPTTSTTSQPHYLLGRIGLCSVGTVVE